MCCRLFRRTDMRDSSRSTDNFRWASLALAVLLKIGVAFGAEVDAGSATVLTFVEVRVEMRGHAANDLRQAANAAREHQASVGQTVVMQEIARPERFAVLEREPLARLTVDISDDLIAPPDRRLNQEFDEVPTASGPQLDTRANFYVIAHIDLAASDLSRVQKALYSLADSARRTDGNLGFESLQEINHPNHFNLISAWLGEAPFHSFAASTAAREFRQAIGPLLGSPYDERLFRRVN